MKFLDKDLAMYAESGLRTSEDWASLGREIGTGEQPRAEAAPRLGAGQTVPLYSRNQTNLIRRTLPAGKVTSITEEAKQWQQRLTKNLKNPSREIRSNPRPSQQDYPTFTGPITEQVSRIYTAPKS